MQVHVGSSILVIVTSSQNFYEITSSSNIDFYMFNILPIDFNINPAITHACLLSIACENVN